MKILVTGNTLSECLGNVATEVITRTAHQVQTAG